MRNATSERDDAEEKLKGIAKNKHERQIAIKCEEREALDPEAKCWDGPDKCVPCLEEGLICREVSKRSF